MTSGHRGCASLVSRACSGFKASTGDGPRRCSSLLPALTLVPLTRCTPPSLQVTSHQSLCPNNSSAMPFTASDICKIILAIFLPPLGVFLERGCNADFWINVILTILGYIPGIVHALYIILN
ncbi:BQ5605_C024g09885 [Microbotryum silenes-dioicae]|uniref:BQ5605_C024g09885 protein n=1 Tax=Microbotryum silenes-dioicae TaxID=796604 RepID=A0A2X0MLY4_9BASI|nr:BQ5605_C024g09885 [Microbotryum silenes-dioicae]